MGRVPNCNMVCQSHHLIIICGTSCAAAEASRVERRGDTDTATRSTPTTSPPQQQAWRTTKAAGPAGRPPVFQHLSRGASIAPAYVPVPTTTGERTQIGRASMSFRVCTRSSSSSLGDSLFVPVVVLSLSHRKILAASLWHYASLSSSSSHVHFHFVIL